jgi:hypothetical protein
MRFSKTNSDEARTMLAELSAGQLTFRVALERESDFRKGIPSEKEPKPQTAADAGSKMHAVIRSALELSKNDSLFEVAPRKDWRFPLAKSHAAFYRAKISIGRRFP